MSGPTERFGSLAASALKTIGQFVLTFVIVLLICAAVTR